MDAGRIDLQSSAETRWASLQNIDDLKIIKPLHLDNQDEGAEAAQPTITKA